MSAIEPTPTRIDRPLDPEFDHVLGGQQPGPTLVEYGSYSCPHCHAAHPVIVELRDRFGDSLRYSFRHRPTQHPNARYAAEIAEVVAIVTGEFWPIHDALMRREPTYTREDLDAIAAEFGVHDAPEEVWEMARAHVDEDVLSAQRSGARVSPTFFVGTRRYEGPWDVVSLSEALLGSLGHRLHSATVDLVRWGPAAGVLLLVASVVAVALTNTPLAPTFERLLHTPLGWTWGDHALVHSLHHWVNHGLLTLFFLVVGLEIKREFTVGRLASWRAAALPAAAAVGGMVVPALFYTLFAGGAGTGHGWGIPIATDTAFAIAIMVLLGARAPVELRVFLTAAVIVDDLAAIIIVALFYTEHIDMGALMAAGGVTAALLALNRIGVYRSLPYAVLGLLLWLCLHASGVHATLAGVLLAMATPTRPPANVHALLAQAQLVLRGEGAHDEENVLHTRPSDAAMHALDAIADRLESPADKLLRTVEPWSSFAVLPLFALANAGVVVSVEALTGHGGLFAGIVVGLVVGKPLGMGLAAALAVRAGLAVKPTAYTWWQLVGAAALGGIGFTMSLFIAELAFDDPEVFTAAKLAVFAASLLAGITGTVLLWTAPPPRTAA